MNGTAKSAGWSSASLADLVAPDAPIGYGIVQPGPSVLSGIPMIAVRDLLSISPDQLHRTHRSIDASYLRSRVVEGDVLISVKGTTGRIGIVPEGLEANISRDVARLRFRRGQVPKFWVQMLRSAPAQLLLGQAGVGTTRQELSIGTLRDLDFEFPSTSEQHVIAKYLADADSLIEALEMLVAKKRDLKVGTAQNLLRGAIRLPGYRGAWHERQVQEIATIVKGKQLGRAEMQVAADFPVWNGGTEPSGYTTSSNITAPTVTVSEGGNSCGWVGFQSSPFWLGGHCYALLPTALGHSVRFLYQALKEHETELTGLRVGSGLPNIQKSSLREFALEIPSDPAEANAIDAILTDADEEIAALEHRLESARAIKTGMMQELLTGRTRLPVAEVAA